MPGHQLLGLGAQRLGLLRVGGRLGLGEQGPDAAQHARLDVGVLGEGVDRVAGQRTHGLHGRQPDQQPQHLQEGGGQREPVGPFPLREPVGVLLVALPPHLGGGPALREPGVAARLRGYQVPGDPQVPLVEVPADQPQHVGRLPAPLPALPCVRLPAGQQLPAHPGPARGIGGQQRGPGVQPGVVLGVEGCGEGPVDGLGKVAHTSQLGMSAFASHSRRAASIRGRCASDQSARPLTRRVRL